MSEDIYKGGLVPLGVVYKVTNIIDGRVYIGQTVRPINDRLKAHKQLARSSITQSELQRDILKTPHLFVICPLVTCFTKEAMDDYEKEYIDEYRSIEFGYNKIRGGAGDKTKNITPENLSKKLSTLKVGKFTGKNHPQAKTFVFHDPEGSKHVVTGGIQDFCRGPSKPFSHKAVLRALEQDGTIRIYGKDIGWRVQLAA